MCNHRYLIGIFYTKQCVLNEQTYKEMRFVYVVLSL